MFSSDISQLCGAQLTMFNNQAQYAHQVGAVAGIGPPMQAGGMVSPNFGPSYGQNNGQFSGNYTQSGGFGASVMTGVGGAMSPFASGLGLVGGMGLLGRAGQYLDPFTGVGRAFMGGAGGMAGIGAGFSGGGLMGGMGAIGGGMAAAALPFAGYYAAGQAISAVGENVAQGARNIAQVGNVAQGFMGPSFGQMGSRPGGQLPRAEIQGIVSALHEIAGQDVMTTMESVKRLMSQASSMGMLSGITDASTFKQKFSKVVDQVKTVAKIMGSTLEEAAPLLGQMQSMGMWKASDIINTTGAMNMVGKAAQGALMGSMQQGAMGSWQQGGTLAAGANLARNQFMNLQSAMRNGSLSNEQLMEFTGGTGGDAGLQMMAGQMTSTMQKLGKVPVGRALMSGLGEMIDGRFTGRIDEKRMAQFQSGAMSMDQVMNRGYSATRSREGAASFSFNSDKLGQELASQGGQELVTQSLQKVIERAGYGGASEDIKGLFLQNILGMNQREAHEWLELEKKLPQIMQTNEQRKRDMMRDTFRRIDERQNRSWQGLKQSIGHMVEEGFSRPIQQFGERMSTSINESVDSVTDSIFGRTHGFQQTTEGRTRDLIRGTGSGAGYAALGGNFREQLRGGSMIESMNNGMTRPQMLAAMGAKTSDFMFEAGSSMKLPAGFEEVSRTMSGNMLTGYKTTITASTLQELEMTAKAGAARTQGMTFRSLGNDMDKPETQARLGRLRTSYREMISGSGPLANEVRELREKYKEGDPAYNTALANLFLKHNSGDVAAMRGRGAKEVSGQDAQDILSILHGEAGGAHGWDVTAANKGKAFNPFGDDAEASAFIQSQADAFVSNLKGTGSAASGRTTAGLAGDMALQRQGFSGGGRSTSLSSTRARDIFRDEEMAPALATWLAGGKGAAEAGEKIEKMTGGRQLMNELMQLSPEEKQKQIKLLTDTMGRRDATATKAERARLKTLAGEELSGLSGVTGLSEQTRKEYASILKTAADGGDIVDAASALGGRLKGSKEEIGALAGAGGVGQFIGRMGMLDRVKGGGRDAVTKQLRDTGLPIDLIFQERKDIREKYDAIFSTTEGDKKSTASKGEIDEFVGSLKDIAKRLGVNDTKGAAKNEQASITAQLTSYTEANTRFVVAVGNALGGSIKEEGGRIPWSIDKKGADPTHAVKPE